MRMVIATTVNKMKLLIEIPSFTGAGTSDDGSGALLGVGVTGAGVSFGAGMLFGVGVTGAGTLFGVGMTGTVSFGVGMTGAGTLFGVGVTGAGILSGVGVTGAGLSGAGTSDSGSGASLG